MKLLSQLSEIDTVKQQLAAKDREYANAIKTGKEFSFVKRIFLEMKELRTRLLYLIRN